MGTYHHPPGWVTKHMFNPLVALLTRAGLSVRGSRVLAVRGRTTGEWHTTPVNPLDIGSTRYLVAPRGNTQWARNLRVSGEGELRAGGRVERFKATEIADDEKPPILREYLRRWKMETGAFFGGMSAGASDEELRRIAPEHPVFRIEPA